MPKKTRSTADVETKDAATLGLSTADPRDPNADKRPPRVQMQQGFNLDFPHYRFERDKFHYRCFSDNPQKPGRIQQALAAYWEHCTDESGSNIRRNNGNGGKTYLMRLPLEYWEEDLQRKKDRVRQTLGEELALGENEYAPTKHNREGGDSAMVSHQKSNNPYA